MKCSNVKCSHCGKEFEIVAYMNIVPRNFCTNDCQKEYWRKQKEKQRMKEKTMAKLDKKTIAKIDEEIKNGYITKVRHPAYKLWILNYTQKCLYENYWSPEVILCRGLIVNANNYIVSRPFDKFFNLNEREETKEQNLPKESPKFYEKEDGSLGISYFVEDRLYIATRGTFTSPQAKKANRMIWKYNTKDFDKTKTYLFEIICTENEFNVVQYKKEELILLAVRDTKTGRYEDYVSEAHRLGLNYAKEYYFRSIQQVISFINSQPASQLEGIVAFYPKANLRVKMKSIDYVMVAKLFNKTPIDKFVFNCISNHKLDDLITVITAAPDFAEKIDSIKEKLLDYYKVISEITNKIITNELNDKLTRKLQAELILNKYPDMSALLFFLLDNKQEKADKEIWKIVYRRVIKNGKTLVS